MRNKKVSYFVPGRLCLFGEHSDWVASYQKQNPLIPNGKAIAVGIKQGIYATGYKSNLLEVIDEVNSNTFTCSFDVDNLESEAKKKHFYSYICGTCLAILKSYPIKGIRLVINKADLPIKIGLSSSAAICVITVKLINKLYKLNLNNQMIMDLAYQGENIALSKCGKLDQIVTYGNKVSNLTFIGLDDNESIMKRHDVFVKKELHYVFCNLNSSRDTRKILSRLNDCFPKGKTKKERNVNKYFIEFNFDIINKAIEYISIGDVNSLGALMNEAQDKFDELVSPIEEELKGIKLHEVRNDVLNAKLALGCKGVGAQGDGSIQFLCDSKASADKLITYLKDKYSFEPYYLSISKSKSEDVIIPIAGLASRLYPESLFIKKAFLPYFDNNECVPLIYKLLDDANSINPKHIIIIVGKNDKKELIRLLNNNKRYVNKLNPRQVEYFNKIERLKDKLIIITQFHPKGLGDAILKAKRIIKSNNIYIMLGDYFYKSSKTSLTCLMQFHLNNINHNKSHNLISIKHVKDDEVSFCGIIKIDNNYHALDMIEKPDLALAYNKYKSYDDKLYAPYGLYYLKNKSLDILNSYKHKLKHKKELSLTDMLKDLAISNSLDTCLVDGESFDMGNPQSYQDFICNHQD